MPVTIGLLAAGGSILGGAIGSQGQKQANKQNIALAREQMRFQERMSGTAYTRAAKDLENAGLNRILALGKPATTPGGQTANVLNPQAPLGAGVSAAGPTAITTARQIADIGAVKAQTRKTGYEADILQPEATVKKGIGDVLDEISDEIRTPNPDRGKGNWRDWISREPEGLKNLDMDKIREAQRKQQQPGTVPPGDAQKKINEISDSLGLDPEATTKLLLDAVSEMDLPGNMTRQQKLQWAVDNPQRIKDYLERRKNR